MIVMNELEIPYELADFSSDTSKDHMRRIADRAPEAYANHVMTRECENVWLCENPKSSVWHFYVALLPHCILVYGDIGEMIIRPGSGCRMGWLRGCLDDGKSDSFEYMLGKVPAKHKQLEFMTGDVLLACEEYVVHNPEEAYRMQEALNNWASLVGDYGNPQESWYSAASNANLDPEWYSGYCCYDSEMYWCAYALQWFTAEWVKTNT